MTRHQCLRLQAATTVLLAMAVTGCVVGPSSIAAGRSVYNEVISRTEDQQLLSLIVHDRYNATYGMLSVASVTANIRANASVTAQWGLSRALEEDYAGNLVPLAAGVTLEENPTISYVPLGGEEFVRRLLSPLSMDEGLMIAQLLGTGNHLFAVSIKSVNNVHNPLLGESNADSAKFNRMSEIWQKLGDEGALQIVRNEKSGVGAAFHIITPDQEKLLDELLELTNVKARPTDGRLFVPMRVSAGEAHGDSFLFETRSVLEVLRAAGACIEIPRAHLRSGVIEPLDYTIERPFIRIRTSRVRPRGLGTIAILYRGWWYYVADSDPKSKQAFQFLRAMVDLRLSEGGKAQAAPVLTIPVGN